MLTPDDIVAVRSKRDWSQSELADFIGVDQGTVSKWETGKSKPSGPARKIIVQLREAAE